VRVFRTLCFLTGMLTCTLLQAQGLVLVEQQTRGGKTSTNQIQLDKTHIRAESRASDQALAFVFDDTTRTARVVNLDRKTYLEMDGAVLQEMQRQMAQFQEQLKNLPPDQRAAIEQATRGRGGAPGAAQAPKLTYRQSGSDKVGKWSCSKYEGFQGQQKVIELCTVDPKELGVTLADFEVAKHLVEFLRGFLPQAADQILFAGTTAEQGFSGVPVRRTTFANGQADIVSELKEVRREAIPPATFDVPPGFTREGPR
jgi:hypothetical protein